MGESEFFDKRRLLWLGFSLYLITLSGGPFAFVYKPSALEDSLSFGLFIQVLFFVGVSLGCLVTMKFIRKDVLRSWHVGGAAAYAILTLLGIVLQVSLLDIAPLNVTVQSIVSLLVGALYAQPLLFWISAFLDISKTSSRSALATTILSSYLPLFLAMMIVSLLSAGEKLSLPVSVLGLSSAFSAFIQIHLLRQSEIQCNLMPRLETPYRLTPHSASILVCLGFSWGVAEAHHGLTKGIGWISPSFFSLAIGFAAIAVLLIALKVYYEKSDVRFGTFIRLPVVLCGAAIVTMPLMHEVASDALFSLCTSVMVVAEASVIIFTVEACKETGADSISAFSKNYLLYVGSGCVSVAFSWLMQTYVGGQTAYWIITIASVWMTLAVIPFLPSRSSGAVVFTLEKLPENEGYKANVAMQRDCLAKRYGLSESEAEVCRYLLEGLKREQIAEKMYLSPWTIKARISSIYKKCGVHSFKELVRIASDDEVISLN